jgi:2'-5' RNA ligase
MAHHESRRAVTAQHVIIAPVEMSSDGPAAGWIADVRSRYDPIATLVPPHFTLVYPFDAEIDIEPLRIHMADALAPFPPFRVALAGVSGSEGQYLFYDIKRGNDVLIAMHDRLYSGPLAKYLDRGQAYHPHMTIGRIADAQRWREALDEVALSAPQMIVTVRTVISYRRYPDGWRPIDNAIQLQGEVAGN